MEQRIREKCTPLEINTLFLSPVFFIPLVLTKANKTAVISEITIPMQMIVCILSEYLHILKASYINTGMQAPESKLIQLRSLLIESAIPPAPRITVRTIRLISLFP